MVDGDGQMWRETYARMGEDARRWGGTSSIHQTNKMIIHLRVLFCDHCRTSVVNSPPAQHVVRDARGYELTIPEILTSPFIGLLPPDCPTIFAHSSSRSDMLLAPTVLVSVISNIARNSLPALLKM